MKQTLILAVVALCAVARAEDTTTWYWRLDTTAETLTNISSDGSSTNWVLKVSELDHDNKTLTLGTGSAIGNAYTYTSQSYEDGSVTNFIVGSGTMDLSTQILDENDVAWTATTIAAGKVFSAPTAVPHALKEFVFPTTIKEIKGDAFNPRGWGASILTSVTMVCPELESIPAHCFYSNSKVTYLLVKCPKVKTIGNNAFRELYDLSRSNADEWDLSGVETIWGSDNGANGAFSYVNVAGTLKLPNVKRIEQGGFYSAKMDFALGLNRTLEYVGLNAFSSRNAENSSDWTVRSVVLCGAVDGWTMSANAMRLDGGTYLKQITFLGPLPKRLEDGESWFGYRDNTELKVCFYLNGEFADCRAILDAATPATDAEIHTFTNANKTTRAPSGVVDASVFDTAHRQFVGTVDLSQYLTPMLSYGPHDARHGDSVERVGEGEIAFGSTVTLRPICATDNTFAEWLGAPADAVVDPVTHEISFKIGYAPLDVRLRTFHPWRLLKAGTTENPTTANRVTDGNWVLNAWIDNSSKRQLGIGRNAYAPGSIYTGQGSGILDLNGPVRDDEGNTWTITRLGSAGFQVKDGGEHVITELILSTNIWNVGSDTYAVYETALNSPTMKRLVMDIPLVTGDLYNGFEVGQSALEDIVLNAPNVKKIGQYSFRTKNKLTKDASEWRLDSLELISDDSLRSMVGLYGTFNLPSLLTATNSLFTLGIDTINIGMAYTNKQTRFTKILNFASGVLRDNASLRSVLFGPYAEISINSTSFKGCKALREVVFLGRPVVRESIDTILQSVAVPADGAIKTAIYVSALLDWENADYVTPILDNDAEKPFADAFEARLGEKERLMGIYNAANGERKAWIVHRPSVCDPKGTILLFR